MRVGGGRSARSQAEALDQKPEVLDLRLKPEIVGDLLTEAFIWIRATLDWGEPGVRERIAPGFLPRVDLWDATFNLPYVDFRAELRRIAQLNLARVAGARVTTDWDAIPDGALVLPTDDDDWFAPDIVTTLEHAQRPGAVGYRWPSTFLERPNSLGHRLYLQRRRLFPWLAPRFFCTTNNYALPKTDEAYQRASSHVAASRAFDGNTEVVAVSGKLSVMNRSLASQTSLGWRSRTFSAGKLRRRYREYSTLYDETSTGLPAWSHEYVEQVGAVMRQLRLR